MTGVRNKRWSRDNVTINQVWHRRREPSVFWKVYQCHHADETIELVRTDDTEGTHGLVVVGVTELRKKWERVS